MSIALSGYALRQFYNKIKNSDYSLFNKQNYCVMAIFLAEIGINAALNYRQVENLKKHINAKTSYIQKSDIKKPWHILCLSQEQKAKIIDNLAFNESREILENLNPKDAALILTDYNNHKKRSGKYAVFNIVKNMDIDKQSIIVQHLGSIGINIMTKQKIIQILNSFPISAESKDLILKTDLDLLAKSFEDSINQYQKSFIIKIILLFSSLKTNITFLIRILENENLSARNAARIIESWHQNYRELDSKNILTILLSLKNRQKTAAILSSMDQESFSMISNSDLTLNSLDEYIRVVYTHNCFPQTFLLLRHIGINKKKYRDSVNKHARSISIMCSRIGDAIDLLYHKLDSMPLYDTEEIKTLLDKKTKQHIFDSKELIKELISEAAFGLS